ncbi:MAG: ribonuclease HI family protein [Propionibacterium sp.]|nr:ribonuclease HI family protein [Propionibacterium sp.]
MSTGPLVAAADGSALGNPGPAGWAWYIDDDCWAAGGWAHGTNNMGELMAVLDLLRQTAHLPERELRVLCDSQYAINVISKWTPGWKRKGWKKADGKPVQNVELVKALDEAMTGRSVTFEWVKGHAGHRMNEAADLRARTAAEAYRDGRDPNPGPGFPDGESGLPAPQLVPGSTEPEPDLFSLLDEATEVGDRDVVIGLEEDLLSPEVRGDPARVAELLHADWREIGASGRIWTRAEMLSVIGPLPSVPQVDPVSLHWLGDDAVVLVWRAITDTGSTLRSSVWQRQGGRWQQRFHQGTPES